MNNFDLIDDYLANRLNEQETTAFKQQLDGDPSLKEEVDFQRQVVEGVQKARALELKTMLQNVPVTSSSWTGGKIAAAVVTAGVVAVSLYYFYKTDEPSLEAPKDIPAEELQAEPEKPVDEAVTGTDDDKPAEPAKDQPKTREQTKAAAGSKKPAPVQKPDIQVTDPSDELKEEVDVKEEANNVAAQSEVSTSKMEVITQPADKKLTFHYQFVAGKLMLYGPFDRNLYEILEIHGNGHAVFLFYKENYYLLDEKETQVKALEPIREGTLLKKLKEYRSQ